MTKIQDFRLSELHCKPFIGKCFRKYRCDSFDYTNSVTGVVGIYINDKTFELVMNKNRYNILIQLMILLYGQLKR